MKLFSDKLDPKNPNNVEAWKKLKEINSHEGRVWILTGTLWGTQVNDEVILGVFTSEKSAEHYRDNLPEEEECDGYLISEHEVQA